MWISPPLSPGRFDLLAYISLVPAGSAAVTSRSDAERRYDRWPVAGENSRPGDVTNGRAAGTT